MASMGSFDSSLLIRGGGYSRSVVPLIGFRARQKNVGVGGVFPDSNLAGVSIIWRNFTEDHLFTRLSPCCGCGARWMPKRVRAKQERTGEGGTTDHESDDDASLRATIQKSKKVLAVQRDLLEQIAERKKLISTIKNSVIDPEGSEQPVVEHNEVISPSLDGAATEDATELGKEPPYNANSSGSGWPKEVPSVPWKSSATPHREPSSKDDTSKELRKTAGTTLSRSKTSVDVPLNKQLNAPTIKTAIRSDVLSTTKNASTPPLVPAKEDLESPPLAGANVMNVIMVSAECAPWSKTGGLGDVAGALPKALARRGHRVMVVAPRYGNYNEAQHIGVRKRYKVDGQDHEVNYFHAYIDGVDFVFIDSPMFRHIENSIYGGNRVDILKRMVLFCKVAVEVPWHVPCGGICYGDGNLAFVANDWHTALLPVYLKAYYRDNGLMKYTRSVLVIHNIAHQGRGPVDDFSYLDLPPHYLDLFKLYDPLGGEHCNIFAAGLKSADRVVTVSHGYSWELKTHEGGWGLHGIINDHDWKLRGIVNGIDTKEWSPELDVHLQSDGYVNYSVDTLQSGKPQCKAALQKELGLPVRADIPLIGFIGRLDQQKGIDLIADAVPWMMGENVQLVMLGTGRPDLEQLLRHFEGQYYDKVRGWVGFSVKTAHRITAGADILLMPSRFEPCGLNQLYAMRYGTIPVVHAVGGLRDTVHPFNPYEESGFGWTFERAEASELIHALGNCLYTYREYKKSWEGLQKRGMTQDLSWDNAAQTYEEVLVAAKYQW